MGLLDNKVAVVTGAAQGIGAAYAEHLASLGAQAILADIAEADARDTAINLRQSGWNARGVHVDISNPESCESLVQDVLQHEGSLDVLVNNAALYRGLH